MAITLPALVMLIGALVWGFCPDKLSEAGRIAFATGFFILVWQTAGHVARL